MEKIRSLTNAELESIKTNYTEFINGFDCNSWSNGKFTNNCFRNCARAAFCDFMEFFQTCWGMPKKKFEKKCQTSDIKLIGAPDITLQGKMQLLRYKHAGCYYTIHRVNHRTLIFPAKILYVWDLDNKKSLPFLNDLYEDLTPKGGIPLARKEDCWPTKLNILTSAE